MKTATIFEVGDRVKVKSLSQFGICYTNDVGGTSEFPVSTELTCEVVRAWGDYETGQRYVGRTDEGQEIYFGQFNVEITPIH
jgi:hypothetical protein